MHKFTSVTSHGPSGQFNPKFGTVTSETNKTVFFFSKFHIFSMKFGKDIIFDITAFEKCHTYVHIARFDMAQ